MSEENRKAPPTHHAYQVSTGKDGQGYFNRVGAAFAHRDGKGYTVCLESLPLNGRVTLRSAEDRLEAAKDGKADRQAEQER